MTSSYLAKGAARLALMVTVAAGGVLAVSAPANAAVGDWERLSAVYSGLVGAVPSPYTANDLQVETAPYDAMAYNGQWKRTEVVADTFTFENRFSHQCLDTENGNSTTAGTPVVQRPCDNTPSQRWVLTRDSVLAVWHITNSYSGLDLAVETGNASGGAGFIQATHLPNNTRHQFQIW